jgi:hypothetical protein
MKKFLMLLITMISLTGCIRMTCMSPSCLGEETYNNLMHPKPYGAHWIKDGMTKESRIVDWLECGGGENLSDGYERKSGITNKEYFDGLNSRRKQLRNCMDSKGYNWIEQCDTRCL